MSLDLIEPAKAALLARFGRAISQGTTLFREGDPSGECFLVVEGRVRLLRRVRASERTVAVVGPGALLGESALLERAARPHTAVALDDLQLVAFPGDRLGELLGLEPELGARLFARLVARLREVEDLLELQSLKDADSKVVSALLRSAAPEASGFVVALSPLELSAKVGVDVETVKRTVSRLQAARYLHVIDERLLIDNLESLKKLHGVLGVKEHLGDRAHV